MAYAYRGASLARRQALQVLFQKEFLGLDLTQLDDTDVLVVSNCPKGAKETDLVGEPLSEHSTALLAGIVEHLEQIDRWIASTAQNWTLERMPLVDRNIIRLASYEIAYCDDVPPAVAINEAVELAKSFGGDDSPRFVNGVLGRIASNLEGDADVPDAPGAPGQPAGEGVEAEQRAGAPAFTEQELGAALRDACVEVPGEAAMGGDEPVAAEALAAAVPEGEAVR